MATTALTRLATAAVWAGVAGSAVFWSLRLWASPEGVPPGTPVASLGAPAAGADLARVLGEDPPPPVTEAAAAAPQSDRFKLIGVLSPPATRSARAAREGVALISVDEQPARAYRVGARVEGDTVLQSVQPRGAVLGTREGVVLVSLQLAPPAPPATGTLPALGQGGAGTGVGMGGAGATAAPAYLPPGYPQAPDKGLPRRPGAALPVVEVPQSVMQTHLGAQPGDASDQDGDPPAPGGVQVR